MLARVVSPTWSGAFRVLSVFLAGPWSLVKTTMVFFGEPHVDPAFDQQADRSQASRLQTSAEVVPHAGIHTVSPHSSRQTVELVGLHVGTEEGLIDFQTP
jgi:NAD-dependent SIR2 family protein deacetylase